MPSVEKEVNLDQLAEQLRNISIQELGKHLIMSKTTCMALCSLVKDHLAKMPMCLELDLPINIVGDIHGQFHDLAHIFDTFGQAPGARYLFLGDYVDRGKYSLEVLVLLFITMLKHPNSMFMLRGNHEAANICVRYGFRHELRERYDDAHKTVLKAFLDCFNWLPVCAIVNREIFCCHGGASPFFQLRPYRGLSLPAVIEQINSLPRPSEPPSFGVVCDLLWADPLPAPKKAIYKTKPLQPIDWASNSRGCSFMFSTVALDSMLKKFEVKIMVRAHQVCPDGYAFNCEHRCLTLFSAPGYCGTHGNKAAILQVTDNVTDERPGTLVQFETESRRPTDRKGLELLFWSDEDLRAP